MDPTLAVLPDVQAITGAASAGRWALALILALSLAVRFFRGPVLNMLPDSSGFKGWCKGTLGGWIINLVGSELAALATMALAGPMTAPGVISALLGGVMVTFGASGFHEFTKDAGLVKPAPVASPAAAGDVLSLPPRP